MATTRNKFKGQTGQGKGQQGQQGREMTAGLRHDGKVGYAAFHTWVWDVCILTLTQRSFVSSWQTLM
jgi:hypothetical protein